MGSHVGKRFSPMEPKRVMQVQPDAELASQISQFQMCLTSTTLEFCSLLCWVIKLVSFKLKPSLEITIPNFIIQGAVQKKMTRYLFKMSLLGSPVCTCAVILVIGLCIHWVPNQGLSQNKRRSNDWIKHVPT